MSNIYIHLKVLDKKTPITPANIGNLMVKAMLTTVIPITNPDFESKIETVTSWLIEFENDSFYPNREIGLDISGNPVMIMPWGKNYGYWTDNNLVIEDFRSHFETTGIMRAEF